MTIRATLWDFGGVLTSSPFQRFQQYEKANNLPANFLRTINATNPNHNAWARLEKNEITPETFNKLFAKESAALGREIQGREILKLLKGEIRPKMIAALKQIKKLGYKTACITNNIIPTTNAPDTNAAEILKIMALFDFVAESSKMGLRKPDPQIYEMTCQALKIKPAEAVYLDDLGINLKPARAMGMTTIKVLDEKQTLSELGSLLNVTFS